MAQKKKTTASKTPVKDQNLMAALTYLVGFITGIIFLLVEKKNSFIRFHAAQSVVLFGGIFVLNMLDYYILGGFLRGLLSLFGFIVGIFLMIKAYQGEKYKLPYIGDLAEDLLKKIG